MVSRLKLEEVDFDHIETEIEETKKTCGVDPAEYESVVLQSFGTFSSELGIKKALEILSDEDLQREHKVGSAISQAMHGLACEIDSTLANERKVAGALSEIVRLSHLAARHLALCYLVEEERREQGGADDRWGKLRPGAAETLEGFQYACLERQILECAEYVGVDPYYEPLLNRVLVFDEKFEPEKMVDIDSLIDAVDELTDEEREAETRWAEIELRAITSINEEQRIAGAFRHVLPGFGYFAGLKLALLKARE